MTTTDQVLESTIVASGANVAPRIKPSDIEANIVLETYFTASDGVYQAGRGSDYTELEWAAIKGPLSLLTFCVLVLRNGFTVTGESACASPENFNAEIGRRIARENAVAKIWPLLGFALKEKMYAEGA